MVQTTATLSKQNFTTAKNKNKPHPSTNHKAPRTLYQTTPKQKKQKKNTDKNNKFSRNKQEGWVAKEKKNTYKSYIIKPLPTW